MLDIRQVDTPNWRDTIVSGSPGEVICHVADLIRKHASEPPEHRPAIVEIDRCPRTSLRVVVVERADDRQLPLAIQPAEIESADFGA